MPEIKKITAKQTFPVRHPVLRKGKPLESCHFESDDLPTTQHFGLYDNGQLEGVISVFDKRNPHFHESPQAQIRGMAVLEHHQGKGYGRLLIEYCESELERQGIALIWFNARENAVGFYDKMGYKKIGASFDIPDVGIHYVMWKKLSR